MKTKERIKRYGEAAYKKMLQQGCDWKAQWRKDNPDKVIANNQEYTHKGGKYYEKHLDYNKTGIRGERNKVRDRHGYMYRPFKRIIAPNSQIHHEWILGTADFRGVALVERGQHMHGIIDVIKILDGEITLLTEEEVKKGGE